MAPATSPKLRVGAVLAGVSVALSARVATWASYSHECSPFKVVHPHRSLQGSLLLLALIFAAVPLGLAALTPDFSDGVTRKPRREGLMRMAGPIALAVVLLVLAVGTVHCADGRN